MSFSLSALDWIICFGAVASSIALGLTLAIRKGASETSAQFFLAGRGLRWPIVGASLFATNIGAEHLVGLSGDAYRYGISAATVELTTALCLGLAASLLFPYYIKSKVFTIPEFLELRYNRFARAFFSGLMIIICIMTKMAFHLYAGAVVLHGMLGWNVMPTVAVMGIFVAIITMIGGFTAVAYTDSIQTAIMVVGCGLVLFVGLEKVGGWHNLLARAPDAMHIAKPYYDANYPFWGIVIGALYGGIFYWGIDQVNVQRVLGARDLKQARLGSMFAILLKLTPVFIFALPGVIAAVLYPGRDSKTTFVTLLNELLPNGIRGLVLAALLSALIGSSLAVMNSVSTLVVRDFLVHFRRDTSERAQVWMGRGAIVISTPLAIAAAYLIYTTPEGIYKYLQAISLYLVMPVMPAIFFGIMSKRITFQGAIVSVICGGSLAILFVTDQLIGESAGALAFPWLHKSLTYNYTYRGFWGTLITTAALYAGSYATTAPALAKVQGLTMDWGVTPEPFQGISDWRLHLGVLGLATVAIYAWLW